MSVRKRAWTTSKGVEKEAWVVDYVDQTGKRRLKTFAKKKVADNFAATANVEIRAASIPPTAQASPSPRPGVSGSTPPRREALVGSLWSASTVDRVSPASQAPH